jgi:putative transcriptional regulator
MNIQHHPALETLLRYAAGTLPAGPGLVIATHLSFCAACRREALGYASVGGELLCSEEPLALAPGALAATIARLDEVAPAARPVPPARSELPAPLASLPIAPWRWLAPGIKIAHIGPRRKDGSLFLLRCSPGSSLPGHRHEGPEYSCVIQGAYSDDAGRYGVGDCEESGSDLSHAPKVDRDSECIAVIAVEGKLQLEGWLPRLFQPLFGI